MNKYLNKGAEKFIDSLEPGTIPLNRDEDNFFEELNVDIVDYVEGKISPFDELKYHEAYSSEEFLNEYLQKTKEKDIPVAVLSVDLVGSTNLGKKLSAEDYSRTICAFLRGVAQIVRNYNGYVLKYIGDEVIAYFPGKGKSMMHDNALYCSYAIKKFFKKILTPLIRKKFSENLKFRIGLNSGKAMIVIVGHSSARLHYDLIGDPINITKKIQSLSYANSILVGESVNTETHNFWKNKIGKINVKNFDWEINVYRLKILV